MSISQMMRSEFGPDRSLSGIGGVETGRDAAEFLLLGAQTVQVRAPEVWQLKLTPPPGREVSGSVPATAQRACDP